MLSQGACSTNQRILRKSELACFCAYPGIAITAGRGRQPVAAGSFTKRPGVEARKTTKRCYFRRRSASSLSSVNVTFIFAKKKSLSHFVGVYGMFWCQDFDYDVFSTKQRFQAVVQCTSSLRVQGSSSNKGRGVWVYTP